MNVNDKQKKLQEKNNPVCLSLSFSVQYCSTQYCAIQQTAYFEFLT